MRFRSGIVKTRRLWRRSESGNSEQVTGNSYLSSDTCSLSSVLVVDMSKRRISLQSFIMLVYSAVFSRFVSLRRSSQYSVSAHSFKAILFLTLNSLRLTEYWASDKFAPIEVPERNSCLASIYSCFSSHRCLYKLYILIANLRLFSKAILMPDNTIFSCLWQGTGSR